MTMAMDQDLLKKLTDRTAHLGVIGLGYVGLPLAISMTKAGFRVTGLDVAADKIAQLQRGESYIIDVPDADVATAVSEGRLHATTDAAALADVDTVNICVPTPLSKTRDPDISYIQAAVAAIQPHMHPGMLIILESTTYPGTTEEVIVPQLATGDLTVGEQISSSPSRPSGSIPATPSTRRITSRRWSAGSRPAAPRSPGRCTRSFSRPWCPSARCAWPRPSSCWRTPSAASTSVLVNEIALMCNAMGIDVWEVIEGAATKPFGFMPFYPGPGLGGHCIPIDPFYLSWKAKQAGVEARFIELAGAVNGAMPRHVVNLVGEALNERGKPIRGSRVLVVGVAYKADIDDTRESPALDVMSLLARLGGEIWWYDPFVPELHETVAARKLRDFTIADLATFDAAVIVTAHRDLDYAALVEACPAIVDTRNALKAFASDKITRL
jgi:UDP-N-acetyl-D-glucosamine dehydrogenase